MSKQKVWQDYVTQAFIDCEVALLRRKSGSHTPPYNTDRGTDDSHIVVDAPGFCVYSCNAAPVAEGIAAALNEATKPAPAPTLLEAAKTFVGPHWAKKRREFLSDPSFRATDLYDTVARNLLLAIERAEAAAKTPPAPTLPEEALKLLRVLEMWYGHDYGWAQIQDAHGITKDRDDYFCETARAILAQYGGGAE